MERARITVFDTTLRDGEQSPGCSMNVHEKLRMAHQLDRLGVDVIEAGFPIASDGDFEAVEAIAASIRRPVIAGLARACPQDIARQQVQTQVVDVEHRHQFPADASREGVYAGDELIHGEGFAEVIIGPEHQAFDALGDFAAGG